MLKPKDIRKMKLEEINKMLKDIEFEITKASNKWTKNSVEERKAGLKGMAKMGEKTSIQRDLRRTKARLLTIKKEKENGNT